MLYKEWKEETRRVGVALGLTEDQIHELLLWSVEMGEDQLEKAKSRFTRRFI